MPTENLVISLIVLAIFFTFGGVLAYVDHIAATRERAEAGRRD
jgi:hypothetical protein